jgi:hypothetical protein
MASAAGTPELRPEGYTELAGDMLIRCTGGQLQQAGAAIPTTTVVVTILPSAAITSRLLGTDGSSEAMLIIDEAGSSISTGVTGYGPQAPQSLCTAAQQLANGGNSCTAYVGSAPGMDTYGNSVNYEVAVTAPGGTTPAQNTYQGKVGDFGPNTVAFYNVPVLPPAYVGLTRTFRITNIRVAVASAIYPNSSIQAMVSSSGDLPLPLSNAAPVAGIVGPYMNASVNASPAGSQNPFAACIPVSAPTLAAQITFTEGFATAF